MERTTGTERIGAPRIGTADGDRPAPTRVSSRTPAIDPLALDRAARGDPDAVAALFAAIHPAVLAYCRARLGRSAGALESPEDVAQTVCLNLLRALPRHEGGGRPFMAYVYASAANAVTDARRRLARRSIEQLTEDDAPADRGPGPEEHGLHTDVTRRARELLDTLPERMREVLVLRVALGLSARSAAELLGMTEQTVRVTQHRALRKLRTVAA
ncbi:MAG: sigma-70 family RNA polymerase sigma factor [Pseudonocardia sp.]